MGENVVTILGARLPDQVDEHLVEKLEGLLQRARAGELTALAFAAVSQNGELGTGWSGATGTRFPLGAAVSILSVRYATGLSEQT